jgi:hypothetical protein
MVSATAHRRIGVGIQVLGGVLILASVSELLTIVQSLPQSLSASGAVAAAASYFVFGLAFLGIGHVKRRDGTVFEGSAPRRSRETTVRQAVPYLAALLGAVSLLGPTFTATVSSRVGEAAVEAEAGTTALAGSQRTISVLGLLSPDNLGFLFKSTVLNSLFSVVANVPKFLFTGIPAVLTGAAATVFGVLFTPVNTYYGFGGLLGGVLLLLYGVKVGADSGIQFEVGFFCLLGATGLTYLHSRGHI